MDSDHWYLVGGLIIGSLASFAIIFWLFSGGIGVLLSLDYQLVIVIVVAWVGLNLGIRRWLSLRK